MEEPVTQPLDDFVDAVETIWKAYVSTTLQRTVYLSS